MEPNEAHAACEAEREKLMGLWNEQIAALTGDLKRLLAYAVNLEGMVEQFVKQAAKATTQAQRAQELLETGPAQKPQRFVLDDGPGLGLDRGRLL